MSEQTEGGNGRLYGLPFAENLAFDPATVYEQVECDRDEDDRSPITIEEWSVHDPIDHVPTVDRILEWLAERIAEAGEDDENGYDQFEAASEREDVIAAVEVVRGLLASKITYRMADRHLRTLTVTFDEAGEPLLDGEPMYHAAAPSGRPEKS